MTGRDITKESFENCGFFHTLSLISGKYKMPALYTLANFGTVRFNEMKRYIGSVSFKTLSLTLKGLEADGLVYRTESGKALIPVLDRMCEWGDEAVARQRPIHHE